MPEADRPPPTWPERDHAPSFVAIEQEVLELWRNLDVFNRSLEQRADAPLWTFYEGPPTANGLPGAHHVESRTFKDVFPRYRTMKGYRVPRKAGWDCHGLPVELEVERALGLDSKPEIETYGIEEFNRRCRESVTRYVSEWERLTERIGFWVDLDDAYWTMNNSYIDSLWWALKKLWVDGLIFEDHRVTPYCARCGTALSDAEVALGYESVVDPSVFVRFPISDGPLGDEGASFLVWTTTPWTLHGNAAVAYGEKIRYQLVEAGDGGPVVIATDLRDAVLGETAKPVREVTSAELAGLHYTAPFDIVPIDTDYRFAVAADFVTTTEGTGLVHVAPAFGGDDMRLGRAIGLPVVSAVNDQGRFSSGAWAGVFVKDADTQIVADLATLGVLLRAENYEHTYPFCWRCKNPLIYYAKPSWYIRTTERRDELIKQNTGIDWHPEHIRAGRFGNWLENNVDWALSRDRYWGTPLPFWRCVDCDDVAVVGSREELGGLAHSDLSDLDAHRPYVDEVTFACDVCGGTRHRVPEVADAWFDSGCMPFAQFGYPQTGVEEFAAHFPADFIAEAIDQTRGWFYTLLAVSTLLFGESSYKSVLCLGHIVDEDGRKMSKSLGNVLDPFELLDRHGADPLRWIMLAEGNPWVSRRVGHQVLDDVVKRFLLTLWNTHVFFLTYARLDAFDPAKNVPAVADRPVMDRWVLAELADLCDVVDNSLDRYDVSTACRRIELFVDDLSNWYVRRSRRRFWRAADDAPSDKAAAHATLRTCLQTVAGLLAPFIPFTSESLYQDLVVSVVDDEPASVHLSYFPTAETEWREKNLAGSMAAVRKLAELGRQARNTAGIRVRQPLGRGIVAPGGAQIDDELIAELADELNVQSLEVVTAADDFVDRQIRPNFRALGPAFAGDAPRVAEALKSLTSEAVIKMMASLEKNEAVVTVGEKDFVVTPEMVEIVETPRTGWQLAADGDLSIALDLELDLNLRTQGAVRDLIRAINDERKRLDLALDDRIRLTLTIDDAHLGVVLGDGETTRLIASEVLADAVAIGKKDVGTKVELEDFGPAWISVELAPA